MDASYYLTWDRFECFRQIFHCVYEAAKKDIYHANICPKNVVFKEGVYQLCGWQFSNVLDIVESLKPEIRITQGCKSPEACRTDRYAKVDYCPEKQLVWNLGLFLYWLYLACIPFEQCEIEMVGKVVRSLQRKKDLKDASILQDPQSRLVENTSDLPKDVRLLVWRCLVFFPEKRPTLERTTTYVDAVSIVQ